ncbi:aliphatic sulfonate ABC transporter substrate-binding protein [Acidisoma cellulosilytica]|uniref:Putative aliphatic sulfonates-binding protein n=1 Tax=Acidisoma cellulosilyticum TaxID=2802395 RepID=A0A963Z2Y1_9PROT|nr:aliphatic sulfonate ABC transporter substrate-binding protein [Acidisoma cellulosilyticum]MCB8880992.1 aliphatic sulfonate ABC transporter substrate-binding protein [Acidisoma cellulosilyticum]
MAITRRRILQASAALLPALALGSEARAEDRVLKVGYQKASVALSLLKAQGLLEQRLKPLGYGVSWAIFTSGPPILEALNDGAVDLAFTGEPPPIFAQAAGVPVVYAAATQPSPRSVAILIEPGSAVHKVADLKGKKVAVAKGSSAHYLLVAAVRHAGLSWSDIQPVYLQPPDGRIALQSGSVDAWAVWDPFEAAAEVAGATVLTDGTGLMPNRAFYLSSRDFATTNAPALKAAIGAIQEIEAWEPAHVDQIASDLSKTIGVPPEILKVWFTRQKYGVEPLTPAIIADQQVIADTFASLHLIPRRIDVSQAVLAST